MKLPENEINNVTQQGLVNVPENVGPNANYTIP
jgi:hypothetical protein